MSSRTKALLPILLVLGAVALVGMLAAAMPLVGLPSVRELWKGAASPPPGPQEATSSAELVPGSPDTLRLPADVVRALRIQTVKARQLSEPRTLELSGTLALDANFLARVHSRFPGEIVQIGDTAGNGGTGKEGERLLRLGDKVKKDQLLAVVWSKDLGEKKSELVDALSRLQLHETTYKNLREAYKRGVIPERSVLEAEQLVESDLIAVARAERTLRSWRLTEKEIQAVKDEAPRVRKRDGLRDLAQERDWAKAEIRAPFAGTILEKNIAIGDIVDSSTDLFKIADLRHLLAWVHVYEEDLPDLLAVPPRERRWTVQLKAAPDGLAFHGTIDQIGEIIDPNQHTALVIGQVNNPDGRLRAGQFITATVELPHASSEVIVPTTAVCEDGRDAVVFVQPDPRQPVFTMRRVAVIRRLADGVSLRSELRRPEQRKGLKPIYAGEFVVSAGAVELKKALEELQAAQAPADEKQAAGK